MDKYIGRLLDNRYEILEHIGTGGMAVVYKARCHRLNRLVAIKILKDDFLEDEDFRRRFHSESQAVAMLSHPNIISVYDVSTSISADYIVMELIDGITLKQYMEKKGVLNWKETLHFAIQIAKALEHAHSRGIVHRDIKPHNVMVLKNGSVKVTDFGIARMMSKGNTLTKEALGSVHYLSPEQAKGGRVDNRSDIYSLGVVMYEMMSGRPPYDGESPVSVAIQHINGGAVMPSTLNPNIPGGLEQIIMRAMAHEPSGRYSTATQMLADLDEFRKDPAILFDYNIPPMDDVMKFPKPQEEKPARKPTEAEQAAQRKGEEGKTPPVRRGEGTPPRRQTPPPRKKRDDEDEKSKKITTIAIISCAVVMVIAIAVFMVVLLGSDPNVEVPNFVGKNFEQLQVDAYEFTIKETKEYNKDHTAGTILWQSIPAGNKIVKGGTLYITVSMGVKDEPVFMPDLTGMNEESAVQELKKLPIELEIEPKTQASSTVAIGLVISTNPGKDTQLTTGQKVTIYISEGTAITDSDMPDVVGLEEEVAKRILNSQNLNLDIKVSREYNNDVEKGLVISTDPEAKTELKKSQTVTLVISQGAKKMPMPNLVNMTVSSAYGVLLNAGFDMQKVTYDYIHNDAARDTVLQQSVPEMTEIPVNSEIVLTVSKGPEQPTSKTKTVTLTIPAGMEECNVTVIDATGVTVATETAAAGAAQITITLTGMGKQTYQVAYSTPGDTMYENLEVNFDE